MSSEPFQTTKARDRFRQRLQTVMAYQSDGESQEVPSWVTDGEWFLDRQLGTLSLRRIIRDYGRHCEYESLYVFEGNWIVRREDGTMSVMEDADFRRAYEACE